MNQINCCKDLEEVAKRIHETFRFIGNVMLKQRDSYGKRQAMMALDYIEKNYADSSVTLNSVCSALAMSTSYFSSIFKNYTGETFIECLTKRRMEKAKILLEHGKLKTYEIAEAVGYSDAHYFSIAFKKAVGKTPTEYGDLDITINLSKPEKDPRDIAKAKLIKSTSYPKCLLCKQNEGFKGNINHPARQNHRIIPMEFAGENWFLQYSPYVYYNEHCIILNANHTPMKIYRKTFENLLGFVEKLPHYFAGSNADLPIVGGSILSHDHYQGGHYTFAMEVAPIEETFEVKGYENTKVYRVKWPMSVIRLNGENKEEIIDLAEHILDKWKNYSDESVEILHETDGEPHNTITPIARMKNGKYELDLVLRNNRTNEAHPMGIFHPYSEVHHIKKENIGLIEVMGLAVLPARLKEELNTLSELLAAGVKDIDENKELNHHSDWYKHIVENYDNINKENAYQILKDEVGKKFSIVLEHAGVFKRDEEGIKAFNKFINSL